MITLKDFDYILPKELIAQFPVDPRDSSKLMVLDKNSSEISHHIFSELPDLLDGSDCLVFNQTKVFPARLIGLKQSGGKTEILLLKELQPDIWQVLHKGKLTINSELQFDILKAKVISIHDRFAEVKFQKQSDFLKIINKIGHTPLPPYITTDSSESCLRKKYQTVYAKQIGSVAAPTAGFHFTTELLNKLKYRGVQTEYITLHVGMGTFSPITENNLTRHQMHKEQYSLTDITAGRLNKAKQLGKRIIAVGTTTTRVLESCSDTSGHLHWGKGETNIFIYPPYKFKFLDNLITNFHLPKSTLLTLISAFVSSPNTKNTFKNFLTSPVGKAYNEAIKNRYRFYSFGDAILIR